MKETYQKPSVEVICAQSEGVMASSTGVTDLEKETWNSLPGYDQKTSTSTMNEIENMLNDFFTY